MTSKAVQDETERSFWQAESHCLKQPVAFDTQGVTEIVDRCCPSTYFNHKAVPDSLLIQPYDL
ncbi:hypothetical protein HMPREF9069_00049 [Atopobium sp. oral taxon 810 str. F0209]|nr:hypothetical protein HMPREF9069_00049 [Atopobium sp. oral taxon 810 str. F0209]